MTFSKFVHARLKGLCTVVPKNEIRLADEIAYYNNDAAKLKRMKNIAGLDRRRIAPEGITASDLCLQAAEHLLKETKTDKTSIDALIFVTQSADYLVPASAFVQHHALGLRTDCAAFDVNLGCSGYVYGLWLAACMLESRARSRVLLLAGDAGFCHLDPANRITTPLFGDAGTASLVEYTEEPSPLSFSLGSNGSGFESLICPGGGARIPHLPQKQDDEAYTAVTQDAHGNHWRVGGCGSTWMDGTAIFDFTMSVVPEHISSHLEHANLRPDQIDYLILHQANKQIVQHIGLTAGFEPRQVPWETLPKYGNQASASIPATICDQLQTASKTHARLNLLLCGYGVGLSWASCIGTFTELHCCGPYDFIPPPHIPTRAERIAYWHKIFKGEQHE